MKGQTQMASNGNLTNLTSLLFTERQAAALMNISAAVLKKWRSSDKGPQFVKLGGAIRYHLLNLERYAGRPLRDTGRQAEFVDTDPDGDHC